MLPMVGTVQIVTPPAAEPASLDLVKSHCRIDHSSDDLLLKGYLATARVMAERYLSRSLITQTLLWSARPESELHPRLHFNRGEITLPRAPVQSIETVTVLDTLGNSTTIEPAALPIVPPQPLLGYIVDLTMQPALLTVGGETVMSDGRTLRQVNIRNIQVEFIAGYGDDFKSVPENIIQAILLTTAFIYEHRGDTDGELPQAAQWLLDPDRLRWMG